MQVTERQRRGHPHSHLIMAWIPRGAEKRTDSAGKPYIYSQWFRAAHEKSGLGTQSKITPVGSVEATAKYVAKYLFKDAMFTKMPKHWKRVRYSQNFPDAPEHEKQPADSIFTLETPSDWRRAEKAGVSFSCPQMIVWQVASHHMNNVRQGWHKACLLYTSPSPRDRQKSRMPSSA